jgi:hypothetical protein
MGGQYRLPIPSGDNVILWIEFYHAIKKSKASRKASCISLFSYFSPVNILEPALVLFLWRPVRRCSDDHGAARSDLWQAAQRECIARKRPSSARGRAIASASPFNPPHSLYQPSFRFLVFVSSSQLKRSKCGTSKQRSTCAVKSLATHELDFAS